MEGVRYLYRNAAIEQTRKSFDVEGALRDVCEGPNGLIERQLIASN
jgi:hypothetical protein